MTRRSCRELEKALVDLTDETGDGDVEGWLHSHFGESPGATLHFGDEAPCAGRVHAVSGRDYDLYVTATAVPEWVDVDADLPVAKP